MSPRAAPSPRVAVALLCLAALFVPRLAASAPDAPSLPSALLAPRASLSSFRLSLAMLNATGLLAALPARAPLTLFVPTDAAWREAFRGLAAQYIAWGGVPVWSGPCYGNASDGSNGTTVGSPGVAPPANSSDGQPAVAKGAAVPSITADQPGGGGASIGAPGANMPVAPGANDSMGIPVDVPPGGPAGCSGNWSMGDPREYDPLLAALSAVIASDGAAEGFENMTRVNPMALQALTSVLQYHVVVGEAMDAAQIKSKYLRFTNFTTADPNALQLWLRYNATANAAQLSALSPLDRVMMQPGAVTAFPNGTQVYSDGTVLFPNGTAVLPDGSVLSYPVPEVPTPVGNDPGGVSPGYPGPPDNSSISSPGGAGASNSSGSSGSSSSSSSSSGASVAVVSSAAGDVPVPPVYTSLPTVDPTVVPSIDPTVDPSVSGPGMGSGIPGVPDIPGVSAGDLIPHLPGLGNLTQWLLNASLPLYMGPGTSYALAAVTDADVYNVAGVVVHGIDSVLIPQMRDLPVYAMPDGPYPMPSPVPVAMNGTANGTDGSGWGRGNEGGVVIQPRDGGKAAGGNGTSGSPSPSNTSTVSDGKWAATRASGHSVWRARVMLVGVVLMVVLL
eukprot:TRINITY_DN1486_c0_g4_i1.p1 TRINITY_DN1486_c0_g4~~TRINITY_DN1486_c0_g4_i1.p1  ORF type:complete len:625 (+),score=-4.49 TRINITY_DN1486_c0_g4_i1:29-1876(+)